MSKKIMQMSKKIIVFIEKQYDVPKPWLRDLGCGRMTREFAGTQCIQIGCQIILYLSKKIMQVSKKIIDFRRETTRCPQAMSSCPGVPEDSANHHGMTRLSGGTHRVSNYIMSCQRKLSIVRFVVEKQHGAPKPWQGVWRLRKPPRHDTAVWSH